MPGKYKRYLLFTLPLTAFIIFTAYIPLIQAYEGLETYYVRYDIKSSKNKIIDDNLLMIPAKNEFRAEKFSQIATTGVISADSNWAKISVDKKIRDDALKTILVKNGLKSVKTKDLDTVLSYEGVIITPVKILKHTYNEDHKNYSYEARVEFSPVSFPDRWETLNMKYLIKQKFYDFLNFRKNIKFSMCPIFLFFLLTVSCETLLFFHLLNY